MAASTLAIMPEDPLGLDPETMRRLGYLTVDRLVERLSEPGGGRALTRASPEEMRGRIGGPPPVEGAPFEQVLEQLWADVLPYTSRCEHPRYFAFIPACGTWPGALGDFIAAALNPYVGAWMEAAGPSQVELEVMGWFAEWIGFPAGSAGILVSGGSAANMTALACAREARLGTMSDSAVVYVSDQAHSSMARAARILGFAPHQVRVLPADRGLRLSPRLLADAIAADTRMGRTPLFVSALAGSTNAGLIDPLTEVAEVCAEHGVWMHVDAAYGGFAALTDRGRVALAGIELGDSVTLDPHKWLYQPFECGSLLVRDGRLLRAAFEITPEYLKDAETGAGEVNFADLGMQLSRGFRALKLWLSLRTFGTAAFARAIDRCINLAALAQSRIEADPQLELLSAASLGIVCFRRRPPAAIDDDDEAELERINQALIAQLAQSGQGLVSSTRIRGIYAVRICILNHTSTEADVTAVLDFFAGAAVAPASAASPRALPPERHPEIAPGLDAIVPAPDHPLLDANALGGVPLLAGLSADELERVRQLARELRVPAGADVIEQWSQGRDLYIVLEGEAVVIRDERHVDRIMPGQFFGEFAALEWGASFAYSRLATVRAQTEMRLAMLSPAALNALLVDLPQVEHRLTEARRRRLALITR